MKLKTGGGGGGDFLQQPAGKDVQVVCCDVVDHGDQQTTFKGRTRMTPKLSLRFQSAQLITEEDFHSQGKELREEAVGEPWLYMSKYTASLAPGAWLTKDLRGWGVDLPENEDDEFDLDALIGRNALIDIEAIPPKPGSGQTGPFMAVQNIKALPKFHPETGQPMTPITASSKYVRVQDREQDTEIGYTAKGEQTFSDGSPVPEEAPPGVE